MTDHVPKQSRLSVRYNSDVEVVTPSLEKTGAAGQPAIVVALRNQPPALVRLGYRGLAGASSELDSCLRPRSVDLRV